jgi:hypothetical protein
MDTTRVFYHICAMNHWESVLRDQAGKILFSGLYDIVETIHCFCAGPEARRAARIIQSFGKKFTVEVCDPEDKSGERLTLMNIHRFITTTNEKVLYLHTKGVTKLPPSENVFLWNFYMEYHLIRHYQRCLDLLEHADVVGLDFYPQSLPHFSGNFWWARGEYLLTLADYARATGDKYTYTETWVCGGHQKLTPRLVQLAHSGNDHYTTPYHPIMYVDSQDKKSLD